MVFLMENVPDPDRYVTKAQPFGGEHINPDTRHADIGHKHHPSIPMCSIDRQHFLCKQRNSK